ncbi:YbjN domain-containing protein [Crassaminicella profunda]|uniref:YbjN domain-containing protein n=1 Tax=Crassaminicella profunda TaxID=1286698 RepID=UPI001CA66D59|nr:YbjN domain-containing protein [Crassaminicella profunda]QZY54480.1 YbjN domain-containing protein [Crassaminicella profunda]
MSQSIMDAIKSITQKNNWLSHQSSDLIKIDVDGQNGNWTTLGKCLEEEERFLFYSICPSKVKKEKTLLMAELLTRINYGLKIGNFEMDFDTGEIHFKTSIDFAGDFDKEEMIEQAMSTNLLTMDEYFSVIMKVIHSDVSHEDIKDLVF